MGKQNILDDAVFQTVFGEVGKAIARLQSGFHEGVCQLVRLDVGLGVCDASIAHNGKVQLRAFAGVIVNKIVQAHIFLLLADQKFVQQCSRVF
jgi:hypothetical protein